MFLTAKLNLVSGMIIGATVAILGKKMCKRCKKHQQVSESVVSSAEQFDG